MKSIYLKDENHNWKLFTYTNLSELDSVVRNLSFPSFGYQSIIFDINKLDENNYNLDFTKNLKLKYVFAKKNSLTYVNFKNVSRNILSADFRENNNLKCITIDNGFIPSTVPIYPSTVPKWQIDSGTNFCY